MKSGKQRRTLSDNCFVIFSELALSCRPSVIFKSSRENCLNLHVSGANSFQHISMKRFSNNNYQESFYHCCEQEICQRSKIIKFNIPPCGLHHVQEYSFIKLSRFSRFCFVLLAQTKTEINGVFLLYAHSIGRKYLQRAAGGITQKLCAQVFTTIASSSAILCRVSNIRLKL